jgi:hypothetical protein
VIGKHGEIRFLARIWIKMIAGAGLEDRSSPQVLGWPGRYPFVGFALSEVWKGRCGAA